MKLITRRRVISLCVSAMLAFGLAGCASRRRAFHDLRESGSTEAKAPDAGLMVPSTDTHVSALPHRATQVPTSKCSIPMIRFRSNFTLGLARKGMLMFHKELTMCISRKAKLGTELEIGSEARLCMAKTTELSFFLTARECNTA